MLSLVGFRFPMGPPIYPTIRGSNFGVYVFYNENITWMGTNESYKEFQQGKKKDQASGILMYPYMYYSQDAFLYA
jgi:hypothetical protein